MLLTRRWQRGDAVYCVTSASVWRSLRQHGRRRSEGGEEVRMRKKGRGEKKKCGEGNGRIEGEI